MKSSAIPQPLRRWLETLGERCEYCQTSEWVTGLSLVADHIRPSSKGGATQRANLCRACSACNTYKHDQTHAHDPLTSKRVRLFNPRRQHWSEHFAWSEDGTLIIGLTACGRATIEALHMNNPRMVRARRRWVRVGWHPPAD
jgi:hypothetical protein